MCGIVGFWSPEGLQPHANTILKRMMDAVRHRGPDDEGEWLDSSAGMALGHRRLAVLDLSPAGHQPMTSMDGRWVISFNGEIYNFRQLKASLERLGARFNGRSDTEIMLAAVAQWGVREATSKFVGMFAFALWDRAERTLHLVRDRLGEKPLYAGWMGSSVLFGSELKSLRAHPAWVGRVNRGAVAVLLRHAYIPQPWSIYEGIRKIPPGTIVSFRSTRPGEWPSPDRYWSARDVVEKNSGVPMGDGDAVVALESLLKEAVAGQMVADVPLGAFLSGGIDSSTIVALMQAQSGRPVRTFTIGFAEDGFNEAHHAKAVAAHLGTEHTELYLTPAETQAVIPRLPTLYDEPFADPSQIPTFLVSELARQQVTVSLSGDGGDELFGGYDRYQVGNRIWNRMRKVPHALRAPLGRAIASVSPTSWDHLLALGGAWVQQHGFSGERIHKLAAVLSLNSAEAVYRRILSHWSTPEKVVLEAREPSVVLTDPSEWPKLDNYLQQMMYLDLVTYLPDDILVKLDRASMGVSLESRVPFLDHRVVEFALRLPLGQKVRNGSGKWILRRVLDRHVPSSLTERPKMGFGIPIDQWLRGPLREWAEDLLGEHRIRQDGFLDATIVREIWREHIDGRRNRQFLLWDVLMFQAWLAEQNNQNVSPLLKRTA